MIKALLIGAVSFLLTIPVLAQNAPDQINAALNDLSTRVNRAVTLAQIDEWNYQQTVYASPALGCPQQGVAYTDVQTSGFQFIITYADNVYDYRVSEDQSIVVLCGTAPAPVSVPPCPPPDDTAFLAPRLSKGIRARVIAGGLPNLLREQPGSSSQLLGQIPPDDPFIVLDGPRCTTLDKIVWWQINYNNLIGWTGEGQDGTYWLEPADLALTATPPTGEPVTPSVPPQEINAENAAAISLSYSANASTVFALSSLNAGTMIVGGADGKLNIVDYRNNTLISSTDAHTSAVTSVAIGYNPAQLAFYVASGGADGSIKIWNVNLENSALEQLAAFSAHNGAVTSVAFNQRGTLLASGGADTIVHLWQVADGTSLNVLNGHTAQVTRLTFSAAALLSEDATGHVMIWTVAAVDAAG